VFGEHFLGMASDPDSNRPTRIFVPGDRRPIVTHLAAGKLKTLFPRIDNYLVPDIYRRYELPAGQTTSTGVRLAIRWLEQEAKEPNRQFNATEYEMMVVYQAMAFLGHFRDAVTMKILETNYRSSLAVPLSLETAKSIWALNRLRYTNVFTDLMLENQEEYIHGALARPDPNQYQNMLDLAVWLRSDEELYQRIANQNLTHLKKVADNLCVKKKYRYRGVIGNYAPLLDDIEEKSEPGDTMA
jgi:hypothetical protein